MPDCIRRGEANERAMKAAAAANAGEIWCLPDGRAGYVDQLENGAANDRLSFRTEGIVTVTKTASQVMLDGAPVYWDHSANKAVYVPASDKDFFLGTAVGDAASADTTMEVNLNVRPVYKIDLARGDIEDEFLTVIVKTVVGSTTVEVPHVERMGGTHKFLLGATAEAQKLDLLSQQGFDVASNWIVEFGFNVIDDGDAAAIDFNIGVANATHASDADAITESMFIHLDGDSVNINAESDDGTTEVAATDTTIDYTLATPVHGVFDGRNPADVQLYINGVNRLGSTVFDVSAATGPLKLLAHIEKTADDTTADYRINYLRVRIMEQDNVQLVNA